MSFILISVISLMMVKEITLPCHDYVVGIELPETGYIYSMDNYTEGTFHDFQFKDSVLLVIHCGANVQKPTIRKGLTNEETVKIGDRTVTRRFGIEEDGIHYWQEDIYNGLPLTVLFRMASKRNAATYRLILDKVVINRRLK